MMLSLYLVCSSLETVGRLLELKKLSSGFAPTTSERFWKSNSENNLYIIITIGKNRHQWHIQNIFSDVTSNRRLISRKKREEK